MIAANRIGVSIGSESSAPSNTSGNLVLGNYIGLDSDGTGGLGNTLAGVLITDAVSNTIGGTENGARNVVSGNGTGISIVGAGEPSETSNNSVLGNYVGLNSDGTRGLGPIQRWGSL